MKTKLMFLSVILISTMFNACVKDNLKIVPSNSISSQYHTITDFTDLEVSDLFKVSVTFSDTEQNLRIEANENLHSLVKVDLMGDKLSIDLKDHVNFENPEDVVLNVFLSTGQLEKIQGWGAVEIVLENEWVGTDLNIDLAGASTFAGDISGENLQADITGASSLALTGNVDQLIINTAGASVMEGYEFETTDLSADLTGACEIALTVQGELDVKATGASTVYYKGNGVIVDQNLSGDSQIIKVD